MQNGSRGLFGAAILLYFVIALEVLIMISPFAAFFYTAFDPVLLLFARGPATRWLASFFLPHMVMPPGLFLKVLRVSGSVLFVGGTVVFLVCAGQVYFHKFFRRGPALGWLYRWIRHPQYLALAATGLGLAILWPRFLTIVLWTLMVGIYYLLARDEERRMVKQFGDQYRQYMARTGMFVPRWLERAVQQIPSPGGRRSRGWMGFALLVIVAVGGAFALRAYTVSRLPLWTSGRVAGIAVLPADSRMLDHRMAAVLRIPGVRSRLGKIHGPVVVYVVPREYIMQGMIADTGPRWRLYNHHGSLAMIADWIFHPFRHLQHCAMGMDMSHGAGGMSMPMHHGASGMSMPMHQGAGGMSMTNSSALGSVRRFIFLRIEAGQSEASPGLVFGIDTTRVPVFFADIDVHNLKLVDSHPLGPGTGWGRVPTPMF